MKKLTAILLIALMTFTFAACGSNGSDTDANASNEITELFDNGYICTMSACDETQYKGLFQIEDSFDKLYLVTADMTPEQYAAYNDCEFDDDGEAKQKSVLGGLENVTVTDVTDKIPVQEELDSYIGKTLGDLENEGFENTGWSGDADTLYQFSYDGPVYSCIVTVEEGTVIEDMDDYSANDLREIKIGKMEFQGLSSYILD